MVAGVDNLLDAVVWFCAGGTAFFAGIGLLVLTALFHAFAKHKFFMPLIYLLYLMAVIAVILSATPLPQIFYGIWTLAFIAWLIIRPRNNKLKPPALCVLIIICMTAALLEIPWHTTETILIDNIQKIYVIGDSVSAGMGNDNEMTWPELLSEELDIPVINLSMAGATVSSALKRQIPRVEGEYNLVFLEIGGNDLLNGNSVNEYQQALQQIIQTLTISSNKIAWFELPSLPQYYTYGRIQRKLAKQYNINLIPKSILATVFSTEGATSDGIHLTPSGHKIMKQQVELFLHRQKGEYHEQER